MNCTGTTSGSSPSINVKAKDSKVALPIVAQSFSDVLLQSHSMPPYFQPSLYADQFFF